MKGLRALRRAAGMSMAELGQLLGVSAQAVSKWEKGTAWPSAFFLPRIAEVFNCSIADLYREPVDPVKDNYIEEDDS